MRKFDASAFQRWIFGAFLYIIVWPIVVSAVAVLEVLATPGRVAQEGGVNETIVGTIIYGPINLILIVMLFFLPLNLFLLDRALLRKAADTKKRLIQRSIAVGAGLGLLQLIVSASDLVVKMDPIRGLVYYGLPSLVASTLCSFVIGKSWSHY